MTAALAACIAVSAARLTTADLAPVAPAFAAIAPPAAIGYAPQPGARRVFDAAELSRIARANSVDAAGFPASICVERLVAPLEETAVRAAMLRALPEGARVEITELSKLPAPVGELVFPREWLAAPPTVGAPAAWTGHVTYDGGRFTVWAKARVAVRVQRVVAMSNLAAGRPIEAADVKQEEVDAFPARTAAVERVEQAVGRAPRRAIAAGSAIPANALDAAHDVDRGQKVAVEVRGRGALLKFEAEAETAGRAGDAVRLRNPSSGKIFEARITGKAQALVETR